MPSRTKNAAAPSASTRQPALPRMLSPLLGLKLLFVVCCVFIIARMELQQFHGKAMWERMIGYPLIIGAIPAIWWWRRRTGRGAGGYPFASDFLLTLGIVLDLLGNIFDLFDTVFWYDDAMHLLNWAFYAGAFGALLLRTSLGPWALFGLTTGFGAITAILWEGVEWLGFIRFGTELDTAYFDTLLDEHLGLLGSAVAGIIVARVAASRRDARLPPAPQAGDVDQGSAAGDHSPSNATIPG